jgi:PadR family transcriptional regulator, regulatory protein PadR
MLDTLDDLAGTNRTPGTDDTDTCICPTGQVERFVQACVLLFLAKEPAHGYDLFQNLAAFGLGDDLPDLATLYRNLRRMEARGLLSSEWLPGSAGPGRRGYQLTSKGWLYLEKWTQALERGRALMDRFLAKRIAIAQIERQNERKEVPPIASATPGQ